MSKLKLLEGRRRQLLRDFQAQFATLSFSEKHAMLIELQQLDRTIVAEQQLDEPPFERPECLFSYCRHWDNPARCQHACQHPRKR